MLNRIGAAARQWVGLSPWTNVYGLARTLIALGTLGTLLFSHSSSLFRPASGAPDFPYCHGLSNASIYCLVPDGQLELARWISVVILLVAASGWRPRWTALPHWWVAFSLQCTATIPDGGDQIAAILTLLILPIALTDRRRWHWSRPEPLDTAPRWATTVLVAWSASVMVRVQMAGIYLHASVAKLGVAEWVDGTAIYYWLHHPLFGAPGWAAWFVHPLVQQWWGTLALTWGPLALEFLLALGLIAKRSFRPYLLAGGIALHLSIALLMGLWSFALVMFGGLVMFLRPLEQSLPLPRWAKRMRSLLPAPREPESSAAPEGTQEAAQPAAPVPAGR
ncbi:MAG TPA: sporulation-delaying protein SdpB family protein [Natronosporangium sp.]|nr:sporulation-delaying protein SdpB family protein [Natronosporangium sp.]